MRWLVVSLAAVSLVACGGAKKGGGGDGGGPPDMVGAATVTVAITIVGKGTVQNGGSTVCDGTSASCSFTAQPNASLSLMGVPSEGYAFGSWQCGGGAPTANATLATSAGATGLTCTVTFTKQTFTLNVNVSPSSAATVLGTPGSIQCGVGGTACTTTQEYGTSVSLSVVKTQFFTFSGWAGDCAGKTGENISVDITKNMTCTAQFTAITFPLTLSVAGPVSDPGPWGTLQTAPDYGTCSTGSCAATQVPGGTPITVTAVPGDNYQVDSWSGDCIGTGSSALTNALVMNAAKTCNITFAKKKRTLTVNVTGGGHVTSDKGGIDAPSILTMADFDHGTMVQLTAAPTVGGATFDGWGGDCSSFIKTNPITVTMDASKTCSAAFSTNIAVSLSVTVNTAQGSVTSSKGGISCGATCTSTGLFAGDSVTLTASEKAGYVFDKWSGPAGQTGAGCSGSSKTLVLSMNSDKACTANFLPLFTITASAGTGGAVSVSGGDGCAASGCQIRQGLSALVKATPGGNYKVKSLTCTKSGGSGTTSISVAADGTDPNTTDATITALADNISCTATFQAQVAVTPAIGGAGTATGAKTIAGDGVDKASLTWNTNDANKRIKDLKSSFTSGAGSVAGCSTVPSAIVTTLSSDVTVTASSPAAVTCTAETVDRITVTGAASGPGTVALDTAGNAYTTCVSSTCTADTNVASQAKLTATPTVGASGNTFTGWTGNATFCAGTPAAPGSISPTVTISGSTTNVSCTANFVANSSIPALLSITPPTPTGSFVDNGAGGCVPLEFTWTAAATGEFWCQVAPVDAAAGAAKFDTTNMALWKKCASSTGANNGQVVTPVGTYPNGLYQIGVEWRKDSLRKLITLGTEKFYLHDSLGKDALSCAKKCPWHKTPAEYFAAAGEGTGTPIATGFKTNSRSDGTTAGHTLRNLAVDTTAPYRFSPIPTLTNPRVNITFIKPLLESRRINFLALSRPADVTALETGNLVVDRKSLRRKFTPNHADASGAPTSSTTMILIQRQYASTRNDGAGGVPGCSQQVTFGVDYGPIGLPYDPNLMETPNFATPYLKRACSAIVVNNKGEGICLQELPVKGQPGVYTLANRGSSLSMWQRLLDADPFSGAGTTSGERWMADQLTLPK